MREIELSRGKFALVDDEDYDSLALYRWYINENVSKTKQYAMRSRLSNEQNSISGTKVYMHRSVLGIYDKDITVKHKNGNTLDNRKENLYTVKKKQK